MNILLFGPPGAGKGTQSELLVLRNKMRHLSTGDLFRSAIRKETKLGLKAKSFMSAGQLVPDEIVIAMVEEELVHLSGSSFILDGFPRTVPQAEALGMLLKNLRLEIGKALFLEVPQALLLRRLTGRRVCQKCGANYHIETKPPKVTGVCDQCAGQVVQRDDDKEEVIKTRLSAYEKNTSPLRDYYRTLGKLSEVDGLGTTDQVFARVAAALEEGR